MDDSSNPPQKMIEDGKEIWVCSDCYFGEMGDEIEKHPIINPEFINRVRRQN